MDKKNSIIWFLIVILVVAGLVFITINNRSKNTLPNEETGQVNDNMENLQKEGVKITILKEGNGQEAKIGDVVSMNYTGTFTDGTAFDSNIDPKFRHVEPFTFNLGAGQVIRGWDVGIVGMKEGEKRRLEISPEFAYGETGAGGVIPPNTTLVFEVELLKINN